MSDRIAGLVHDAQNADGGFGQQNGAPSDAISTAYALIILAGQFDAAPLRAPPATCSANSVPTAA